MPLDMSSRSPLHWLQNPLEEHFMQLLTVQVRQAVPSLLTLNPVAQVMHCPRAVGSQVWQLAMLQRSAQLEPRRT